MKKRKGIQCLLLLFSISITSYAYVVSANFTIENNTDTTFNMEIKQPNQQPDNTIVIPAHDTSTIFMTNGDHGGLLYQASTAIFTLKANNKTYAQGRIVYYAGAAMWSKYSFLDAITAADGLNIDPSYSCKNGGYASSLNNKITISGNPHSELIVEKFPTELTCNGLKSHTFNPDNLDYTPTCFNGNKTTFWQKWSYYCDHDNDCDTSFIYTNDNSSYWLKYAKDPTTLEKDLNANVGYAYCGSWKL